MAKSKQNLYGQEMGAKGAQTQAKILKATNGLIGKTLNSRIEGI